MSQAPAQLYVHPTSHSCRRALATARHIGAEVEEVIVDLPKGAHKAPEFLAINPNGMVPALVVGELQLWESTAIARYLIEVHDSDLLGRGEERHEVERWLAWGLAHLGPASDTLVFQNLLFPMWKQPTSEDIRADAEARFRRFSEVLDAHLEGRDFVATSRLTLADFTLASFFTYAEAARMPMQERSKIEAWLVRLDDIPAWRSTAPQF